MIFFILIFMLVIILGFAYSIYILVFMWSVAQIRPIGLLLVKSNVRREEIARIKKEWMKLGSVTDQYHFICVNEDTDFTVLNGPALKELKK